jgi:3',5'-cyclic AMP phosphodiesterase CpdA
MQLVQISDLHFLPAGVLSFGKVDTHGHLVRCLEQIGAMDPAPDALLITGDLTNDGDPSTYHVLAALLEETALPCYAIPGNHDDRELIRESFPEIAKRTASGPLCYVVDDLPVRLIALDSSVTGKPYGRLGEAQRAWLEQRLAEAPDRPTLLALHHPPFKTGIGHMDWSMLRDAAEFEAITARYPAIERVLCGHVHRPIQRRFAGTIAQIAPGIAHQVKLTLNDEHGPWIMEPPGFLLHCWEEDEGLVTHQIAIGDFGPEGHFSDPHKVVG